MLPDGLLLFVAISLANASNYLFQVIVSRGLGPSDYSLLGGIYAVITVISVSTAALQAAAAKGVAANRAQAKPPSGPDELTPVVMRWSIPVAIAFVVASPVIARFLHSGLTAPIALAIYVFPAALLPVAMGRLQGMEAFTLFGFLSLGLAMIRLVVAPVMIYAGFGVNGVVLSSVALSVVAAALALRISRRAGPVEIASVRGDVARASAALVIFWIIASLDVPVARNVLDSHTAGQYAAASVVGKAVLWLPGAVSLIMFPRVALLRGQGEETHPPLIRALAITVGLCVGAALLLRVLGTTVIPLFFGSSYKSGAAQAWKIGFVCVLLAVSNLLIFYHLTRETWLFLAAPIVALVIELAGFARFHKSFDEIVGVLGAAATTMLLGLLVPGLRRRWRDYALARRAAAAV
jgi:O-antigen/teichoic acid export membrane protein